MFPFISFMSSLVCSIILASGVIAKAALFSIRILRREISRSTCEDKYNGAIMSRLQLCHCSYQAVPKNQHAQSLAHQSSGQAHSEKRPPAYQHRANTLPVRNPALQMLIKVRRLAHEHEGKMVSSRWKGVCTSCNIHVMRKSYRSDEEPCCVLRVGVPEWLDSSRVNSAAEVKSWLASKLGRIRSIESRMRSNDGRGRSKDGRGG